MTERDTDKNADGKECRWCGRVFSPVEVPERFCSEHCAARAAGINLEGDIPADA